MQTRINPKNGDQLSALGFGCMRLPADERRAIALLRTAIDQGVNYFDTAYIYQAGRSEVVLGKALADGYRQRVKIATKLPPFMVNKLENAERILASELSRLQTDYIDYYLLHMLSGRAVFDRLVGLGVLDWLEGLRDQGVIRNIGFSFHGSAEDFAELVQAYPWDFCQIQYNYLDEHNQAGTAGLALAASLGLPVIVMEPLRGGKLVTHLPAEVKQAFAAADSSRSPAEWALRWVWNHPEVTVVLSGMNDEEQLVENLRIASEVLPQGLTGAELQVFERVKSVLLQKTKIPCTGCGYCLPCPFGVDIPGCFTHYNEKYLLGDRSARWHYLQQLGVFPTRPANASLCQRCGKCEQHCPQAIPIRQQLQLVSREMEGVFYRPLVRIARRVMKVKD